MGSYGVIMFVQSIQFLPACRMFLAMCPGGAEGASYAMLTTLSNLAGVVSYSISAAYYVVAYNLPVYSSYHYFLTVLKNKLNYRNQIVNHVLLVLYSCLLLELV
jgi:hypothetical protein